MSPSGSGAAPTPAAYVVDVRGDWAVAAHREARLIVGAPLAAGDSIVAIGTASSTQRISVLFRNGDLRTASCPAGTPGAPGRCGIINIPRDASGGTASWISRAISAIMAEFKREPDQYASLVTRGISAPGPADAVILLRRDTLSLAPALIPLAAGTYRVCVVPIGTRTPAYATEPCPAPLDVAWDSTANATAWTPGLQPGLYELRMLDRDGMARVAWILVASPARFAGESASFERLRATAAKWQEESLPGPAAKQLLRAHLAALAAPGN